MTSRPGSSRIRCLKAIAARVNVVKAANRSDGLDRASRRSASKRDANHEKEARVAGLPTPVTLYTIRSEIPNPSLFYPMKTTNWLLRLTCAMLTIAVTTRGGAQEYLNGIEWQEPPVVTPSENGGPPSDAVVLFGGKDLSAWEGAEDWRVENGAMVSGKGDVRTKAAFGDCQLHIEWSAPTPATGSGQGRGNSG